MTTSSVESTSRFRTAAIQLAIAAVACGAVGCGGRAPDADPLASIAESVSEERRTPPPLAEAWRVTPESALTLKPAVGINNVYLAQGSELVALNAATGQLRWAPVTFDSPLSAAPVALGQQVVVASQGGLNGSPPPRIYWFANDGTLVNQTSVAHPAREISAVPGTVVYISNEEIGRVGGGIEWTSPVAGPRAVALAEPLNLAYVSTDDGRLIAFDIINGTIRWEFDAGGPVSRPHVSGQRVFVGTESAGVVSLDATSGDRKWAKRLGTTVTGAPAVAGDLLWVGAQDAKLRALKASNGTEMEGNPWLIELSSRNYLDIVTFDRWVVVGAAYGPWLAVRGPTRYERLQVPTRVPVRPPPPPGAGARLPDLTIPAGSGPAGVAVVNNDGALVFLQPQIAR